MDPPDRRTHFRAVSQPPSPPETLPDGGDSESSMPMPMPISMPEAFSHGSYHSESRIYSPGRNPGSKRASSVGYTGSAAPTLNGGLARGSGNERRGPRWLVIVVPPSHLPHSPPPAHVSPFSNGYGPSGRFSSGILMPLQRSLASQLASIAREYSLPSVGGTSLFLSLPPLAAQAGLLLDNFKPRVTEESWPILFASFLEAPAHPSFEGVSGDMGSQPGSWAGAVGQGAAGMAGSFGLPIAARLEFDVDQRRARWYESWVNGVRARQRYNRSRTGSILPEAILTAEVGPASGLNDDSASIASRGTHNSQVCPSSVSSSPGPRRMLLSERQSPGIFGSARSKPQHAPLETFPGSAAIRATDEATWTPSPEPEQNPPQRENDAKTAAPAGIVVAVAAIAVAGAAVTEAEVSSADVTQTPTSAPVETDVEEEGGELMQVTFVKTPPPPDLGVPVDEDCWPKTPISPDRLESPDLVARVYPWSPATAPAVNVTAPPAIESPDDGRKGGFMGEFMNRLGAANKTVSPSPVIQEPAGQSLLLPKYAGTRTYRGFNRPAPILIPTDLEMRDRHVKLADISDTPTPTPKGTTFKSSVENAAMGLPGAALSLLEGKESNRSRRDEAWRYPFFNLYPAIYPYIDLYPKAPGELPQVEGPEDRRSYPWNLAALYPPVYPHFELWPSLVPSIATPLPPVGKALGTPTETESTNSPTRASSHLDIDYPHSLAWIYPAVCPMTFVYPETVPRPCEPTLASHSHENKRGYPHFDLYPALYPHIEPYPATLPIIPGRTESLRSKARLITPLTLDLTMGSASIVSPEATPLSPDRLPSPTLYGRLMGSLPGSPTQEPPLAGPLALHFVSDGRSEYHQYNGRFDKSVPEIEVDHGRSIIPLAQASELSPVQESNGSSGEFRTSLLDAEMTTHWEAAGEREWSERRGNHLILGDATSKDEVYGADGNVPISQTPRKPEGDAGLSEAWYQNSQLVFYEYDDDDDHITIPSGITSADFRDRFSDSDELVASFQDFIASNNSEIPLNDAEERTPVRAEEEQDLVSHVEDFEFVAEGDMEAARPSVGTSIVTNDPILFSFPEPLDISEALAHYVLEAQNQSIHRRGRFLIAVSGGSLPKILAAGLLNGEDIQWNKWEIFYCDEGVVPLDHPDSNHAPWVEELYSKVPIQPHQIHTIRPIATDEDPASIAQSLASEYEKEIVLASDTADAETPKFDLVLLGMGPDGHVCSLFPAHPLLREDQWFVAWLKDAPKPPSTRITFTLRLLHAARRVAVICSGEAKQEALATALEQPELGLPVSLVNKTARPVVWFTDYAAGGKTRYPKSTFWDDE